SGAAAHPDDTPRRMSRLQTSRRHSRELEELRAEIPQGDAGGIPPCAEGIEGECGRRTENRDRGVVSPRVIPGRAKREPGISQSNIEIPGLRPKAHPGLTRVQG